MKITVRQLKRLINEEVKQAKHKTLRENNSKLTVGKLKRLIKEQVQAEKAEEKLDIFLNKVGPEVIEKLEAMVSSPEFKAKKEEHSQDGLEEGLGADMIKVGGYTTAGVSGMSLAWLTSMIAQYGLHDPHAGLSAGAITTLASLLAAGTVAGITAVVMGHMEEKRPSRR